MFLPCVLVTVGGSFDSWVAFSFYRAHITRSSQTVRKQTTKKSPATGPPTSSASSGETPSRGEDSGAISAPASADEILVQALKNFQVMHSEISPQSLPVPTSASHLSRSVHVFPPAILPPKKPCRRTVCPAGCPQLANSFILPLSLPQCLAPSFHLLFSCFHLASSLDFSFSLPVTGGESARGLVWCSDQCQLILVQGGRREDFIEQGRKCIV